MTTDIPTQAQLDFWTRMETEYTLSATPWGAEPPVCDGCHRVIDLRDAVAIGRKGGHWHYQCRPPL